MTTRQSIAHLTSAHPRNDTRIFYKMCHGLSKHFNTSFIVADGKGDQLFNDVRILDVGKVKGGRLARATKTTSRVYNKALELDADIYHLHDPELMHVGLKLVNKGKKVIYDAHEDLPVQILSKPYLNPALKTILSKMTSYYEARACRRFDVTVAATPFIRDKFRTLNAKKTIDINNFPILSEYEAVKGNTKKLNQVCYAGGISGYRGINEIVSAANSLPDINFKIAGDFESESLHEQITLVKSSNMGFLGYLSRDEINDLYQKSVCGLVTLHPRINYLDALPVKMFEYMAAGIPVIASNFPLWKRIVDENDCGICVDPLKPQAIANAVSYLVENPEVAKSMGNNGKNAILEKYNWHIEEKKLHNLYINLLNE